MFASLAILVAGIRGTALADVQKTCMVSFVRRSVLLIATLTVITYMAAKVHIYSKDNVQIKLVNAI